MSDDESESTQNHMKKLISLFTLFSYLSLTPLSFAYDLSHLHGGVTARGPMTIALVPFAEKPSASLDKLMEKLSYEVRRLKGARLLDRKKTEAILQYYLRYVNETSAGNEIETLLTSARQQLLAGDFKAAARSLDQTEKKIVEQVSRGGSNEGLHQVFTLKAKIDHANNNTSGVQKNYDRLVLLHPDLDLDPDLYSKWERAALKSAKGNIGSEKKGTIVVNSTPAGSEVILNGIHRGITPMTLENLPPALHVVEVKTVHHAPFLRQIRLQAGENTIVKARLNRISVASDRGKTALRPSLYKSDLEISRMISTLGYHLGVDKVILVADHKETDRDTVIYRVGDTVLGAVQKQHQAQVTSIAPDEGIAYLVSNLDGEIQADILKNPARYVNQTVGSLKLHEKKRPFYKRPIFWVLVGVAGAGTGGALGAALGAGGAATAGGVVIGL